jgi:hypothetical protein
MKRQRGVSRSTAVAGYVAVVLVMSAGAATGLSGSNTVYSDDIVDTAVKTADLGTNSVSRSKIQDNAVAGSEVIDGSITGADIRDETISSVDLAPDSVGRSELDFSPISDVTKVTTSFSLAPNQSMGVTANCPASHPVVLSGGYTWGVGEPGFALWESAPTNSGGWQIEGQNVLPQSKPLFVYAICASVG